MKKLDKTLLQKTKHKQQQQKKKKKKNFLGRYRAQKDAEKKGKDETKSKLNYQEHSKRLQHRSHVRFEREREM